MGKWFYKLISAMLISVSLISGNIAHATETIELRGDNTVLLATDITYINNDTFAAAVVAKRTMLPIEQPLYVLIGSHGGVYDAAMVLIKALADIPNITLICQECDSAAGAIFATFKGPRLVLDNSSLMMHELRVDHVTAKIALLPEFTKILVDHSDAFDKLMYTVLKISKADYETKIVNKMWTLKGQEIVKANLADKLIKTNCDSYMIHLVPEVCSK
jgi:ATP-dependent protease ClpP protease subunit